MSQEVQASGRTSMSQPSTATKPGEVTLNLERPFENSDIEADQERPNTPVQETPNEDIKIKSSSFFDKLPLELKDCIWDAVAREPCLIHLKFEVTVLTSINLEKANQEIYVNWEWYDCPKLWKGLSATRSQDDAAKDASYAQQLFKERGQMANSGLLDGPIKEIIDLTDSIKKASRIEWADSPFHILLHKKPRTPRVRREVDWFFLDGFFTAVSRDYFHDWTHMECISPIKDVFMCAFRVDDLYDALCRTFSPYDRFQEQEQLLEPHEKPEDNKLFSVMAALFNVLRIRDSCIQELIFIVGDFREGIQPCHMDTIVVDWAEEDDSNEHKLCRIVLNPILPRREENMIKIVQQYLEWYKVQHYNFQCAWLDDDEGRQWLLVDYDHNEDKGDPRSQWITTPAGTRWLEEKGMWWLTTEPGRWWLGSEFGSPWLDTGKGMEWLETNDGESFLESHQHQNWLNFNGSEKLKPGDKIEKRWFSTRQGQEWKNKNYPDGQPPRGVYQANPLIHGAEARHRRQVPNNFLDKPPPKWRFVKCPNSGSTESQGSREGKQQLEPSDPKGKGKEVARS
ncbi:hypothetical protein F5B20DRAFT_591797 [Whalleya microplaca]|nr:hypothetical protein F5B20DRAFT_591797 [Whalleya microplaca]